MSFCCVSYIRFSGEDRNVRDETAYQSARNERKDKGEKRRRGREGKEKRAVSRESVPVEHRQFHNHAPTTQDALRPVNASLAISARGVLMRSGMYICSEPLTPL